MKLWLLLPSKTADKRAFANRWDVALGFVILAETEERAREIASSRGNHGDEGPDVWKQPWNVTCEELRPEGEEGVVLRDFAAG